MNISGGLILDANVEFLPCCWKNRPLLEATFDWVSIRGVTDDWESTPYLKNSDVPTFCHLGVFNVEMLKIHLI